MQYIKSSLPEKTILFYIKRYFSDVQWNVRLPELNFLELDIFIPTYKIAIEYDGSAWHKSVSKDFAKDILCEKEKIRLIRIREEGLQLYNTSAILIETGPYDIHMHYMHEVITNVFNIINDLTSLSIKPDIDIDRDYMDILLLIEKIEYEQSLAVKFPEIAKEWDYEKNKNLAPTNISSGSSKRVYWKCEHGHTWRTSVSNRTNKDNLNKCPYCMGLLPIKGETDLATVSPEIAKQWNYERNGDLRPDDFLPNSGKKVWWKCEYNHEWQAPISARRFAGCPICSNRKILKGFNDLETIAPFLAKQWNYERNKPLLPCDVVPGSNKKVWWKCDVCGYEWKASPTHRYYSKHGCPACVHQVVRRKVPGAKLYDSIGRPMYNDLESVRPDIAKQWDYERNGNLKPLDVNAGSEKKVWWICEKGHHYEARVYQRATKNEGATNCPYCANKKVLKGFNDLETLNPEVAKEWNYEKNGTLKPSDVVVSSGKRVWWKCKVCGYEWEASVVNRSSKHNQTKCPICTHEKVVPGINDFATLYPELLDEWNYSKNVISPNEISGGNAKKVWWKCRDCSNEWEASIASRTKLKTGCPKCRHKQGGKVRTAKAAYPILQLTKEGTFIKEWSSIREASDNLGISASLIRGAIQGTDRRSAGGFRWRKK